MTREHLQEHGIFIDQVDHYCGDIHFYTDFFYMLDNRLFCFEDRIRQMPHPENNVPYITDPDVSKTIKDFGKEYFTGHPFYIGEEGIRKLEELANKD